MNINNINKKIEYDDLFNSNYAIELNKYKNDIIYKFEQFIWYNIKEYSDNEILYIGSKKVDGHLFNVFLSNDNDILSLKRYDDKNCWLFTKLLFIVANSIDMTEIKKSNKKFILSNNNDDRQFETFILIDKMKMALGYN